MRENLINPGESRVLDAYAQYRRKNERKTGGSAINSALEDLGRSFQKEIIGNASSKDWEDFLRKEMELRLSRTLAAMPNLTPEVPAFKLTRERMQEIQDSLPNMPVAFALDLTSIIPPNALALMYPEFKGPWTYPTPDHIYTQREEGYFFYEDLTRAPHTRTSVYDLIGPGGLEERTGLRLMHSFEYIIASNSHNMRTGKHFDQPKNRFSESTWSRIRNPSSDSEVLCAFHPYIGSKWVPKLASSKIGARLVGRVIQ